MIAKSLILAGAASALMAGAAFAQSLNESPDKIQASPTSPLTVNPVPEEKATSAWRSETATTGSQSDASGVVLLPPSLTIETVTNGPVPDTPENRAMYGMPESHAGKMTAPRGN